MVGNRFITGKFNHSLSYRLLQIFIVVIIQLVLRKVFRKRKRGIGNVHERIPNN